MRMNSIEADMNPQSKKATNLTLDAALVRDAKEHEINLSAAAEDGLRRAVASAKAERWLQENREALDSANAWVTEHGLPLAKHRQF